MSDLYQPMVTKLLYISKHSSFKAFQLLNAAVKRRGTDF